MAFEGEAISGNSVDFDVRVAIDDQEVTRLIEMLKLRGKDLPTRKIAVVGVASVMRNFKAQGRPEKWKPVQREGMILQKSGDLKRSVQYRLLPDNVEIYSDLPYAGIHQFGSRPSNPRFIAARPFMMWQDEDIGKIQRVLANHLAGT